MVTAREYRHVPTGTLAKPKVGLRTTRADEMSRRRSHE
jgi:hypothetical protein